MAQRSMGWAVRALTLLLVLRGTGAFAQALAEIANETAQSALADLSQRADVIFAGQVTAVRRHEGQGGASGTVEIDFAVQDAVRGVAGGLYTLREWGGLWQAGQTPFRVGQRYLMLLHAPGPGGLSSPVGGQDGAIPIRGGAGIRTVDLRWMAARVERPIAYTEEPTRVSPPLRISGIAARDLQSMQPRVLQSGSETRPSPMHIDVLPPESSTQAASYDNVLNMLHGLEKGRHGKR
jgi:hypothetical protein